jgi:hypothetical protein
MLAACASPSFALFGRAMVSPSANITLFPEEQTAPARRY